MKEWTQLTTKRYAGRRRSAPGGRFVVLVTPAVRICCTFCPGNRAKTYTRCAEQALRFGGSSPVSSRGTRQSERECPSARSAEGWARAARVTCCRGSIAWREHPRAGSRSLKAATLWGGEGCVVSHRAAALHGLPAPPRPCEGPSPSGFHGRASGTPPRPRGVQSSERQIQDAFLLFVLKLPLSISRLGWKFGNGCPDAARGRRDRQPDQRIAEDLRLFVGSTLSLTIGGLRGVLTLISFVAILWMLSGPLTLAIGSGIVTAVNLTAASSSGPVRGTALDVFFKSKTLKQTGSSPGVEEKCAIPGSAHVSFDRASRRCYSARP